MVHLFIFVYNTMQYNTIQYNTISFISRRIQIIVNISSFELFTDNKYNTTNMYHEKRDIMIIRVSDKKKVLKKFEKVKHLHKK